MTIKKSTTSKWIEVRNSEIHGQGVFAAKDIPAGTKIIEYVGDIISKEESDERAKAQLKKSKGHTKCGGVYIFELNNKEDIDGNVEWNTARLINHSCDPNCETEGDDEHIWIKAISDIKKGDELSYDYCYDPDDFEEHPCKCGSDKCMGYIVNEKYREKLRRKLKKLKNNS